LKYLNKKLKRLATDDYVGIEEKEEDMKENEKENKAQSDKQGQENNTKANLAPKGEIQQDKNKEKSSSPLEKEEEKKETPGQVSMEFYNMEKENEEDPLFN